MATICAKKNQVRSLGHHNQVHVELALILGRCSHQHLSCVLSDRQETGVLGLPMMVGEQKKWSNSMQKVNLVAFDEHYEL